ncbi:hypothetical protein [Paenibacillus aceti]|uniref:DUF4375 domain-containing protein n=1 Tax=Paenibacillus aceti TaxID=1820010 RepID=A0ABQ1VP89_9BACL|nr:hypothetical protein [Paenibacillus aceti]GGF86401.1 hypothetical protein GCM10010913_04850 [Paenibacillus aceti]
MTTLKMTFDVKKMDDMNAEEMNQLLFNTLDEGKHGLLLFVYHMAGKTMFEDYNFYIRNDKAAKDFIDNIWDGNFEDFKGNMQRYVDKYIYSVDEVEEDYSHLIN